MALLNRAPAGELVAQAKAHELAEQLKAAEAHCASLRSDLAEARIVAEPVRKLLKIAEDAWELTEQHSVEEATKLEARRAEAATATQRVADLEKQLGDAEGDLTVLRQSDAYQRGIARVAELWPPACRQLIAPTKAFLAALRAQRAAWETLDDEHATGTANVDLLVSIGGMSQYDDQLTAELERFLAAAAQAGLGDGKK